MLVLLAMLVLILLVLYWVRIRVWADTTRDPYMPIQLLAMLVLLVFIGRSGDETQGPGAPVLVAFATDVSLSMGAIPDPDTNDDVATRLARAQRVLLPVLANLSAAARPVLVSVTAFTSKSETILAWDDDLSLAREIIEFVLSTGLLTEAGSDLGVALNGVVPHFESLPETFKRSEHPKFLLIISDGEQTASRATSDVALAKLRELGVQIITLHVGASDVAEGLPVYDENNIFVGFEEIGGQIFSVPDAEIMRSIAGADAASGLFVSADDRNATATITDYIGLKNRGPANTSLRLWAILLLCVSLLYALLRWF
jgi:hypothetical protein